MTWGEQVSESGICEICMQSCNDTIGPFCKCALTIGSVLSHAAVLAVAALHMAAANGHVDLVRLLVDNRAVGALQGVCVPSPRHLLFGGAAEVCPLPNAFFNAPCAERGHRQSGGQHPAALGLPQRSPGGCKSAGGGRRQPQCPQQASEGTHRSGVAHVPCRARTVLCRVNRHATRTKAALLLPALALVMRSPSASSMGNLFPTHPCRHDLTPVDEALARDYQPIVDLINASAAPAAQEGAVEGMEEGAEGDDDGTGSGDDGEATDMDQA
jgi:hypothetical protein